MSDLIFLKGLLLHGHHGVMPHEGVVGQRFVIDLELRIDLYAAGTSDRLTETVSYADVVEEASKVFAQRRFKLIEAAAHAVGNAILARFPRVEEVRVTLHKPHAPISAIFDDVGVSIALGRPPRP
jgi:dihydroneopterin aldolase